MSDERGGRYYREARFFLAGDRSRAQMHTSDARMLMGEMRDSLALGGPPVQVRRVTLEEDGTTINATMVDGQFQAEIYTPPKTTEEEYKNCAPFWSGLFNTTYPSWVSKFYPSPYQISVLSELTSAPIDPPLSVPSRQPGEFSGELRIVVQLLAGMENPGSDTFSPNYVGTTGLVRIPVESGTAPPEFWLVKFPAFGYGMLAMRYHVCTDITPEQAAAGLEYVPIPEPNAGIPGPEGLPAALASGDVIEIMTLNDYEKVFADNYYAPYPQCGWAFSRSGHEAQNVLYAFEQEPPYLMRTHQFKFRFTATSDSITCTGSEVSTGTPTTNLMAVCPRFPNGAVLYSMITIFTLGPTTGTAPLYVYYDGDEEQVWSLKVVWHDKDIPEVTYGMGYCPSYFYTRNYDNSFFEFQYLLNGKRQFGSRESGYVQINDRYYAGPPSSGPGNYIEIPGVYGMGNLTGLLYDHTVWQEEWTEHVVGDFEYGTMYVPPYQREGVYTLQHKKIAHPTVNHNHRYAGTPISGELWPYSGGVIQWERYDPNYHNSILQCPTTAIMYNLLLESGSVVAWDGHSDSVPASTGGLSRPSPGSFTVSATEPEINLSYLKYWGGGVTTVASSLSQGALDAWFAPAGGDIEDQWIYAYMDALNNTKHILAKKINAHDASDYTTNTTYPVNSMPGTGFHFVGIAVEKQVEEP